MRHPLGCIMKIRPILFSSEMVQAILAGEKTQTRRVVKCRMEIDGDESGFGLEPTRACPYGLPGDWLWVRSSSVRFFLPPNLDAMRSSASAASSLPDNSSSILA